MHWLHVLGHWALLAGALLALVILGLVVLAYNLILSLISKDLAPCPGAAMSGTSILPRFGGVFFCPQFTDLKPAITRPVTPSDAHYGSFRLT